ncbi:hypothetical protein Efla_000857 [Eimeria flavescens]
MREAQVNKSLVDRGCTCSQLSLKAGGQAISSEFARVSEEGEGDVPAGCLRRSRKREPSTPCSDSSLECLHVLHGGTPMARLQLAGSPAGGPMRAEEEGLVQGFWLDYNAFMVFGRQVETPVVRSGNALLLLDHKQSPAIERNLRGSLAPEQQWLKRYCALKGNLLFYAAHSDAAFEGAYLVEDLSFKISTPSRALVAGVIPRLPPVDEDSVSVKDGALLMGVSRHDGAYGKAVKPLLMLFHSLKVAAAWKEKLETCNASLLQLQLQQLQDQLERERAAVVRERETTALITKQQQLALEETEGSKRSLLLQIERLEQWNQRLQASGEVTEKAAAEFADQKVHEVSFLQNELATQVAGSKRLEQEIVALRDVLSNSQQKVHSLTAANSQLNCKVADFLKDLEEARDNPSRFTLLMALSHWSSFDGLQFSFREENRSLTQNFHQLENKFREKRHANTYVNAAATQAHFIRQIAERGDVFDFMRKWLICSEHKIRFYERSYLWSPQQEQEELNKIEELQRSVRVAEAAARSSYISHRAFLLGEQLKACTVNSSQAEVYSFLRTSLDRFGWIFGEVEPYQPKGDDDKEMPFWRDVGDSMAPIPLREQIYPFAAVEGGVQFSLVPEVCVLRPVQKLVPAGEYLKLKNTHALLELDFSELKDVHQQASLILPVSSDPYWHLLRKISGVGLINDAPICSVHHLQYLRGRTPRLV